jgi:hypothetical protein
MLCVLESARSLSLWALITDISATDATRDRQRTDELAELRHQNELAALAAQRVTAAPPVAVEPPPAAIPPPEPEPAPAATPEPEAEPLVLVEPAPEMTNQEHRSRLGGLAAQHNRRADKVERLLVIGPVSTIDAAATMKVAAE